MRIYRRRRQLLLPAGAVRRKNYSEQEENIRKENPTALAHGEENINSANSTHSADEYGMPTTATKCAGAVARA